MLGQAMQLTNILRDVGEDLERGRVYLPQSLLTEYGVSRADLERGVVTPEYRALMRPICAPWPARGTPRAAPAFPACTAAPGWPSPLPPAPTRVFWTIWSVPATTTSAAAPT